MHLRGLWYSLKANHATKINAKPHANIIELRPNLQLWDAWTTCLLSGRSSSCVWGWKETLQGEKKNHTNNLQRRKSQGTGVMSPSRTVNRLREAAHLKQAKRTTSTCTTCRGFFPECSYKSLRVMTTYHNTTVTSCVAVVFCKQQFVCVCVSLGGMYTSCKHRSGLPIITL